MVAKTPLVSSAIDILNKSVLLRMPKKIMISSFPVLRLPAVLSAMDQQFKNL
jgi:hypothetical protein